MHTYFYDQTAPNPGTGNAGAWLVGFFQALGPNRFYWRVITIAADEPTAQSLVSYLNGGSVPVFGISQPSGITQAPAPIANSPGAPVQFSGRE